MGFVRHRAQDDQEADVETAAGGQDGVSQTNARPHCQDRGMVESDAQRVPERRLVRNRRPMPPRIADGNIRSLISFPGVVPASAPGSSSLSDLDWISARRSILPRI